MNTKRDDVQDSLLQTCTWLCTVLQLLFVNNQEMAFSFLRYTAVTKITIYNTPLFVDFFFFFFSKLLTGNEG